MVMSWWGDLDSWVGEGEREHGGWLFHDELIDGMID